MMKIRLGDMSKLAVLDGDILAYRCAAACEKRSVLALHNETLESMEFKTVTEFKEFIGDKFNEYSLTPQQEAQPVENALYTVKQTIQNITARAKCDSYHVVVSGENNFRLHLPLPTRYKASRKDNIKPLLLQECKKYLIDVHEAEVSEGCEADDVLVGYMYKGYKDNEYVVQCSIDKDSKHGPGWVFDWTTMDAPEFITGFGQLECIEKENGKTIKGKGRAFLWYQILFGDPIDSYKPSELAKSRFGEMKAYTLLKSATTDKEALEVLVKQYKTWYPSPVTYTAWDGERHTKDWLEILQMYADCAWMRRWPGDILNIEKLLTKLGVK